jgi:hypothetical protein
MAKLPFFSIAINAMTRGRWESDGGGEYAAATDRLSKKKP